MLRSRTAGFEWAIALGEVWFWESGDCGANMANEAGNLI